MYPSKAGIIIIICLFLGFLIMSANANKNQELRRYYEDRHIHVISNRVERLTNKYRVTLIGSVHGNEPAGHYALTDMSENNEFDQYDDNVDFFIFADPNEHGRKHNKRNSVWGDINRLWPKEYSLNNTDLVYPVQTMLPYINGMDVVVDIHEAVGYNRCQKSLGNTIYISDPDKKDIMQPIIDELNATLKNAPGYNHCDQWDILTSLPSTIGALDEYVRVIPKDIRPLYILIEVPGQNNVQALEKRIRTIKFLIHNILLVLNNLV